MAKKQTKETQVKDTWEMKDRRYYLIGDVSPLTYTLRSRGLVWFDEEKGYERELRNTSNQRTPFVDEFQGDGVMEHVSFIDGVLTVPRNILKERYKNRADVKDANITFEDAMKGDQSLGMKDLQIHLLTEVECNFIKNY